MNKILTTFVAAVALTTSSSLFAQTASESVMVHDAYARAMPPGQPNSGAFMTFKNSDSSAHAVVSADSPVSKVVELHTHIHENGMMMMRRIDQIDIPANGETVLKPGGLHVMFIGLKHDLKVGQKVPVTLTFEDGSKQDIEAPVRKIMMKMNKMPGMKGMGDMKMHKMH
ncbi:MAG: copper chaperone PCu(A)C [Gammaproteobacteria bacterium]|nr:copper chaperone PCu(A)C [Gammaproteobacteria bacterium]MCW8888900.1 copper chaperone PCu(A)C [Gammaproteobacteria bacterium]